MTGSGVSQRIVGRLMTMPGMKTSGGGGAAPSTFMRTISLIR